MLSHVLAPKVISLPDADGHYNPFPSYPFTGPLRPVYPLSPRRAVPDKIKKPDLRLSLYTLFSTYGPVLDVVVMKTAKMRGQAHVVFRDVQASTQAMRALQGFDFYGKEMVS